MRSIVDPACGKSELAGVGDCFDEESMDFSAGTRNNDVKLSQR